MDLDGFHLTGHKGHVGYQASASSIERSTPLPPKVRNAWKYHDDMPEGVISDRYFYSYEDLEQLTTWTYAEVKRQARVFKLRWRMDNTTKERQFYLFDLLATSLNYLAHVNGAKYPRELLTEALEYQREQNASLLQV